MTLEPNTSFSTRFTILGINPLDHLIDITNQFSIQNMDI